MFLIVGKYPIYKELFGEINLKNRNDFIISDRELSI